MRKQAYLPKVREGGFLKLMNAYLSQNVMKHYID